MLKLYTLLLDRTDNVSMIAEFPATSWFLTCGMGNQIKSNYRDSVCSLQIGRSAEEVVVYLKNLRRNHCRGRKFESCATGYPRLSNCAVISGWLDKVLSGCWQERYYFVSHVYVICFWCHVTDEVYLKSYIWDAFKAPASVQKCVCLRTVMPVSGSWYVRTSEYMLFLV